MNSNELFDLDAFMKRYEGLAVMVYNSNPGKKTLAYISQLNPDAGELIAENRRSKSSRK